MTTLATLIEREWDVPQATVWYLTDVAEARGRQAYWECERRRGLIALHERAVAECSSVLEEENEGEAPSRPSESAVRGYREARRQIDEQPADLPISEETITRVHALCRGGAPDAGRYGQQAIDVVQTGVEGGRVRLAPVDAADVPGAIADIVADWHRCLTDRAIHPLIALAAFNLDFLCIHPFQHGNGCVSRLLWLLQSRHLGYDVGRYVSLERVIEDTKERYHETLLQSSLGWHEGTNDPWPYVNYVLATMRSAYAELAAALE